MSDTPSVASFLALLQAFKPHFTAPTYQTFLTLACGWVLSLGRHTITAVVRAASAVGRKHIRSFHRFFSTSVWQLDALGLSNVYGRLAPSRCWSSMPSGTWSQVQNGCV